MVNQEILQDCLEKYKEAFSTRWQDEDYKWEMIEHFQKHWDINADNFYEMFTEATDKTYNLLTSVNNFPRGMIQLFSEQEPETVRNMFKNLFDENQDLIERIINFQSASVEICERVLPGKQHFQRPMAITVYLWLKYPDKYSIYKYTNIRRTCIHLKNDSAPKKGDIKLSISVKYELNKYLQSYLANDEELMLMFREKINEDRYWKDANLVTLADDFITFIASKLETWIGEDFNSGITTDKWVELIQDSSVFDQNSLKIMKRMLDYGGQATCTQLSEKYGGTINFYNVGSTALAKRVVNVTQCKIETNEDYDNYWEILYVGRYAKKQENGVFLWKLRDELKEALKKSDLSKVLLYEKEEEEEIEDSVSRTGWWLVANPKIWSLSSFRVGEVQEYTLYNENGHKRRIFQNFLNAKNGDIVIGYESQPVKKVVALLRVVKESDDYSITFEKIEDLINPIDFNVLKGCKELDNLEFFLNPQGSLFKVNNDEFQFIMDVIRELNPKREKLNNKPHNSYTKENFLNEVYMEEFEYESIRSILLKKKNIILQGAPGVGKTFAAKRLAFSILGRKEESNVEFVQFHQNYSYEDFVMGYKPNEESFELRNGIFYNFCKKAANDPMQPYFFIIDEINRGNMSKIFGELLMLIEADYRGEKATLAYTGTQFSVPENLYLIGMMNTADRSLAMIDYALRRRFSFVSMEPGFLKSGFVSYQKSLGNDLFNDLIKVIIDLNDYITKDPALGKGFVIGHSYFCKQAGKDDEDINDWLQAVVDFDIIPTLEEYWFDSPDKVSTWKEKLQGVFADS